MIVRFLVQIGSTGLKALEIPGAIGGLQVDLVVAWFLGGLFVVLMLVYLCTYMVGRFNPRVRRNLALIFLLELLLFLAIVAVIAVAYKERQRRGDVAEERSRPHLSREVVEEGVQVAAFVTSRPGLELFEPLSCPLWHGGIITMRATKPSANPR